MRPAHQALTVVVVVVGVEYTARRVVAPLLPVLAASRTNDMLATGVAYVALSLVIARMLGRGSPGRALLGVAAAARRWQAWVGAAAALATALVLGMLDHVLWGAVTLPSLVLPWQATVLAAAATWLPPVSMLLVNGVVVPIAEEWLWRGVIQPRLVAAWGVIAGIGVTAVLFSAKHAVVDASLGRLLTIVAGGIVLGWVARAATWKASAVSHVAVNTLATSFALIASTLQPAKCLEPQPEIAPELRDARDRALALIDSRDRAEVEALFTPGFQKSIPPDETLRFYERVHTGHGHCSWECTTEVDGSHKMKGLLKCDHGAATMTIGVEPTTPHRVNYLVIRPRLL